ncbi:MAG: hypothetical protein RI979_415, partial [Pseudomonadota bacterium]
SALRAALARDPSQFDRIEILRATEAPMTAAAQAVIRNLGAHGQAEAAG